MIREQKRTKRVFQGEKPSVVAEAESYPSIEIETEIVETVPSENPGKRIRPMLAKVNKKWFMAHFADLGWSLRRVSKEMGINLASVSLTLDGKRVLTAGEAVMLARFFGEPVTEVLRNVGIDVRSAGISQVVVRGTVGGDGLVEFKEITGASRMVASPLEAAEDLQALRVTTGKLKGWVLFYRKSA